MKQSHMIRTTIALGFALVLAVCGGWAGLWGSDGHKIVAQVAYDNLTPTTKTKVDALLGGDELATFAVWPDQVKHTAQYTWTAPYHFADMDAGDDEFDMTRDCPGGKCVVQAILDYSGILSQASTTKDQKVEALKFLTHYVGDIHQPLHIGHKTDKGGNGISVKFYTSNKNLHAVWDESLIKHKGKTWSAYATDLEAKITPTNKTKWQASTDPADWATESHHLAEDHAYRHAGAAGALIKNGDALGDPYFNDNIDIVDEQLTKAGLRLAALLNKAFDPPAPAVGDPAPPQGTDPAVKFVGSRKSNVYHFPGCKDVQNISEENLVEYSTAPAGKRLHQGCPR